MVSLKRGFLVVSSLFLAVGLGCATGGGLGETEAEDDGAGASGGDESTGGDGTEVTTGTTASSGGTTTTTTGAGAAGGAGGAGGGTTSSTTGSGGGMPVDGVSCSMPADVTTSTMPVQLVGSFTDTTTGGSCDSSADNSVWFSYTPAASGYYAITLNNATSTNAYSRATVYETTACAPNGTEVACSEADDITVSTMVELVAGTPYLIQFYTDGQSYTMVNPSIDIVATTIDPGDLCQTAVDVTAQTMPHQLLGQFDVDPPQGSSCDSSPNNAVWMQFTPTTTQTYVIDAVNNTTTAAWSRLAVFETNSCSPLGTEVFCDTETSESISGGMVLDAGTTYTIAFHTDGDSYTMVDPTVNIVAPGPDPACAAAEDVSGMSFPHTVTGTFDSDPMQGGSCDTTPTNAAYFTYTPSVTGSYNITANNSSATNAYSRLAVFETSGCDPYGAELACVTNSSVSATASGVTLQAGTSYLILFYTDGDSYTMVDPDISISQ